MQAEPIVEPEPAVAEPEPAMPEPVVPRSSRTRGPYSPASDSAPTSASGCPKNLEVDSTTLWVSDAVFLLFIMPIWLSINRSIRAYADESAGEHQELVEEIELEN